MGKPCGLMKPCHLVKPVSATRVSGRYLTHQKGLPTLPVPSLQQTCERYITALEPILEAEELQHTKELVEDFKKVGGVGRSLQSTLEERARKSENWVNSWIDDDPHCVCLRAHMTFVFFQLSEWWVQVAYLTYRLPVVVHSSPGLVLPRMNFRDKQGQIRY